MMGKVHPDPGGSGIECPKEDSSERCEYALGILRKDQLVRRHVCKIVQSKAFDVVVIFFILLNSLTMAMIDYRVGCLRRNEDSIEFGLPDKKRCGFNEITTFLNDYVFGVAFLVEMLLKVIALGFYWEGKTTYLNDKWNVLDFICVLAWIVGQLNVPGMPNFTYFRNFRLLRPLKSLSKFPGLRAIVSTFLTAIPRLKDVVILLLFLLLVCSIACMQFFKGYLHYRCRLTRYPTRVPDTWYQKCAAADGLPNCIYNRYFPTEDEMLAYRNISISWDFMNDDQWSLYKNSTEYLTIIQSYGWNNPDSWACTTARYNQDTGYPHGIPVTPEYPGRLWGDRFRGKDGENSHKPWGKPKRCAWLVDEADTRPCSLPSNNGLHQCYKNTRQQRGRYHHSASSDSGYYTDKAVPIQRIDPIKFSETTCGSNYDFFGNRRFRFAPKLYQRLNPRKTIPGELTDWSRYSPTFFRTMYPEFIPDLNFGYTNFDSIGYAMITLFQAVTMEGWTDIMYMCMDVFSPGAAVSLFLGLFAVGSMLVLNLVLGVIADTLGDEEEAQHEREEAEREADGTPAFLKEPPMSEEDNWAMKTEQRRDDLEEAGLTWRIYLLNIAESNTFAYLIYFCILANTVALCLDDYPRQNEWSQAMELSNALLTLVFIIEMFIKLGALGLQTYMEDQFNIFDGCIVVVSMVDLGLAAANVSFGGGAVFSALRCFRVFRIFKLAKSWSSLQVLLATIYETTQEIGNFLVLLLLFAFIFALAGQQLFANQFRFNQSDEDAATYGKVKFGVRFPLDPDQVGRRKSFLGELGRGRKKVHYAYKQSPPVNLNFDDFGMAFVTVFGILTGESWNLIMYDMIRGTSIAIGSVYMGLTIIILSFCLMNMFLAILLSKFENNEELSRPAMATTASGRLVPIASMAEGAVNKVRRASVMIMAKAAALRSASKRSLSSKSPKSNSFGAYSSDGESASTFGSTGGPPRKPRLIQAPPAASDVKDLSSQAEGQNNIAQNGALIGLRRLSQQEQIQKLARKFSQTDLALGVFPPENSFRQFCSEVVEDPRFDKFIMVCILLSSMCLAIQSPLMNPESTSMQVLAIIDYIFTVIFIAECFIKIVADGFLQNGDDSYLRKPWNILDFTIVCISVATLLQFESLKALKVLRVFRVFRPLRMLSRSPGLRLVLNSLIIAIPSAINVMVVCILYMFIFAIMGVGFFKGQMKHCDTETYPLADPSLYELIEQPITLRAAISNGAFERLYNATQGEATCWLSWDEDFINKKSYFNYDTDIASEFAVGVDTARRERNMFFLSSNFANDIEKARNGFAADTRAYFIENQRFLSNVDAVTRARMLNTTGVKNGNLDSYMPTSKDMCRCLYKEESAWTDALYLNFDTVSNAFLLLFEIYSTEGWLDYMIQNADQRGIEMQPIRDQNYRHGQRTVPRLYSFLFHVAFQVVGGLFVMQLFVGVIMEEYMKLKASAESDGRSGILMTASQSQWVKTQNFMMHKIRPKRKLKPKIKAFHTLVEGEFKSWFEAGIMSCICLNGVVMAADAFGQPTFVSEAIRIVNYLFAGIFTMEAVLKIGGIGWDMYWLETWNRIDFCIVVGTLVGILLTLFKILTIGGVASVVRLFRVARIFRIFNSAKNMRKQIAALISALPGLFNVFVVLLIIFLIWSIMLVDMFAGIEYSDTIHEKANFHHVPIATLTLIRFTTGENWNGFMHELGKNWKSSGCYDSTKFEQIRKKMYRGNQREEYWQDKWCTRLDGGDRPVCPCASFDKGGHIVDVCQEFSTYENCCVPLASCGDKWWAGLVIRIFDLLVTGVVLNLFVANILDAYQQEDAEEDLSLSNTDLEAFVEDWARFDENATWHITFDQLKDLIQILDEPMGFGEQYVASNQELEDEILKLGLTIRKNNIIKTPSVKGDQEENLGQSLLHIMDVATALGKRVVAKQLAPDDTLDLPPEAQKPNAVSEDATPYLERYFGRKICSETGKSMPLKIHGTKYDSSPVLSFDSASLHKEAKPKVKKSGAVVPLADDDELIDDLRQRSKQLLSKDSTASLVEDKRPPINNTKPGSLSLPRRPSLNPMASFSSETTAGHLFRQIATSMDNEPQPVLPTESNDEDQQTCTDDDTVRQNLERIDNANDDISIAADESVRTNTPPPETTTQSSAL